MTLLLRYHYGYSVKRQAFAWLGMKYLNEIRAGELLYLTCIPLTHEVVVWTNGGKPVDYIGATSPPAYPSPAPSLGSTQLSQQSTLVADEAVEEEGSSPPQASKRGLDRSTTLADAARNDPLSAKKNPKPVDPVATRIPNCNADSTHKWDYRGSNNHKRSYRCKVCPVACKEGNVNDRWQADPNWASAPAASQSSTLVASTSRAPTSR